MQGYCDVSHMYSFVAVSPVVKRLYPTSSRRKMCMPNVRNVIYHKFSYGGVSYTLNGKKVNIMLEYIFDLSIAVISVQQLLLCSYGWLL